MVRLPSRGAQTEGRPGSPSKSCSQAGCLHGGCQVPPSPFFVLCSLPAQGQGGMAAPAHPSPSRPFLLRRDPWGVCSRITDRPPSGINVTYFGDEQVPYVGANPTAGVPKTPYVHSWHEGPRPPGPGRHRPGGRNLGVLGTRGWAVAHDAPSPGRFNGPPLRDAAPLVTLLVAIAARCCPVWVPPVGPRSSFGLRDAVRPTAGAVAGGTGPGDVPAPAGGGSLVGLR